MCKIHTICAIFQISEIVGFFHHAISYLLVNTTNFGLYRRQFLLLPTAPSAYLAKVNLHIQTIIPSFHHSIIPAMY
jgi:hypothetical protein